jgi:hypothetical protein
VRALPNQPFQRRLNWGLFERNHYAYGVYYAARQAKALGLNGISVIEFGVAGGNGLLYLEQIAREVSGECGLEIEVFGFDTGEGMPEPIDFRDLPYIWQPGFFKMDVVELRKRLTSAELILGMIEETVVGFMGRRKPQPIGFISFDMDYYSATKSALQVFDSDSNHYLPRVFCYFDDCVGDDFELHSEFAGELLAIQEFNQEHSTKKIARIYGMPFKRLYREKWNEEMFVMHDFEHPLYEKYVLPRTNWQIPLQ